MFYFIFLLNFKGKITRGQFYNSFGPYKSSFSEIEKGFYLLQFGKLIRSLDRKK